MHTKTPVLLLAVSSNVAFGFSSFVLTNNAGRQHESSIAKVNDDRYCICVKNTQTASVEGMNGGLIKLFSTNDCTGNYQTLGSNGKAYNTYWVNSVSWGKEGIPSRTQIVARNILDKTR
ncbi:hypothetical protein CPB97_003643 [Podila verticillata]|nr:hypothetical protein CPB97_003643 [Podila verticillata]